MNKQEIRFAEVLLWKAEILIQLNRREALPLINRIRQRAANSTEQAEETRRFSLDELHTLTYKTGEYCTWTKDFALEALQWENRLESACEGRTFFDLLRWGILEPTMNALYRQGKDQV